MTVKKEESFGIIPLSKKDGVWRVFLVQLRHSRFWGFPKGHPEKGESPKQTAQRELKEETNLDVIRFIQESPLTEQYQFKSSGVPISKQVQYFLAEVEGEPALQSHEIRDGAWVTFQEFASKPTHAEGKAILKEVEKILSKI
jgi:bis(5'-nucleosidyl)-tetraphosphatase